MRQIVANVYLTVGLWTRGKKMIRRSVHILVLTAFRGPKPQGTEACHNNGNPYDNRIDNLRWDTRSSNAKDRSRHLVEKRGVGSNVASLTPEQVIDVCERLQQGESQRSIARATGIHFTVVWAIRARNTYKYISQDYDFSKVRTKNRTRKVAARE